MFAKGSNGPLSSLVDIYILINGPSESLTRTDARRHSNFRESPEMVILQLKGHCTELKYYADGIHSGLTPPG